MAIVVEHFDHNGEDFTRTYSDAGRFVVREGVSYDEAVDPAKYGRTYTEGELMPVDDEEPEDEYATAGRILLGEE